MLLNWDWVHPVMPVPFVPTLGPVHPSSPLPELFAAVAGVADSGEFLPYDKDRRWSRTKAERLLVGAVRHDERSTLLPTLSHRGRGAVKVYVYGAEPGVLADATALARKLADAHEAGAARVVWFLGPDEPEQSAAAVGTRVQLKDFAGPGPEATGAVEVRPYHEQPEGVRVTFARFAEEMKADGLAFLHEQMSAGTVGPVLTVAREGQMAGAIGPLETMIDEAGRTRLLPQYFAVHPEYRGHGYGRALWRAAMTWGRASGAAYQLLQTEVGGASDRLCQAEGLAALGFVCTQSA
ncbi:GNAT family N-acetyltransferase (plasmid) [Streptomyces sp. NBC_01166]|uniref:GNAT family N-acetyltransferase n=1 Tax=Streptomyces sp. NBC_01166 TaxID=2903755 RepID=UPI002F90F6CB|nr:GNAT family N-acetyltransferase [Streptomyces sp. NBC_01166]